MKTKRKTCLLSLVLLSISWSCVLSAGIEVDMSRTPTQESTRLDIAPNGVPMVQIAPANAAGYSHNDFTSFDVDARGVVLQNNYHPINTTLAGYIPGNSNLVYGEAQVIVNEVHSMDPTVLNGFIEVAGRKADVIVANPQGVLVDGGGFIHTDKATLATGVPVYKDGTLTSIQVLGGEVHIEGEGLNALGADKLEILNRATRVNAAVFANDMSIVGGKNTVPFVKGALAKQTKEVTPISAEMVTETTKEPTAKQGLVLDLAALGLVHSRNMYVVGTEQGLGVHVSGLAKVQDYMMLDIEGNLRLPRAGEANHEQAMIAVGKQAEITAQQIENTGTIYSDGSLSLQAKSIHNEKTGKILGKDIRIQSESIINERSAVSQAEEAALVRTLQEKEKAVRDTFHKDPQEAQAMGVPLYAQLLTIRQKDYNQTLASVKPEIEILQQEPAGLIGATSSLVISASHVRNEGKAHMLSEGALRIHAANAIINKGATIASKELEIQSPRVENVNNAYSVNPNLTITTEPTMYRIESGYHPEKGQVFPQSEFTNPSPRWVSHKDSKDPAIRGKGLEDFTIIRNRTIHLRDAVAVSNPGIIQSANTLRLQGYIHNEDSQLLSRGDIVIEGIVQNKGFLSRDIDKVIGTDQFSHGYRDKGILGSGIRKKDRRKNGPVITREPEVVQSALNEKDSLRQTEHKKDWEQAAPVPMDSTYLTPTVPINLPHVEANANFTDKIAFLSSDYMYQRITYDPVAVRKKTWDGARIEGNHMRIHASGTFVNEGRIQGNTIELMGERIDQHGYLSGERMVLRGTDIYNTGHLYAAEKMTLEASGNLVAVSPHALAGDHQVVQNQARIVIEKTGTVSLVAGQDIQLDGVMVRAGSLSMEAGKDISLGTVKRTYTSEQRQGKHAFGYTRVTHQGTSMAIEKDITLAADNIRLIGNDITADSGVIRLRAQKGIELDAVTNQNAYTYEAEFKQKGLLGSRTDTLSGRVWDEQVQGTLLSGHRLDIESGQDLSMKAAKLVADNDVHVAAKGKITSVGAQERHENNHFIAVKESGILSAGKGIMIGSRTVSDEHIAQDKTLVTSLVGSTTGTVTLQAKGDMLLHATDIKGTGGVSLTANQVELAGDTSTYRDVNIHTEKQKGLSISLGAGIVSTLDKAVQGGKSISQRDDKRLQALEAYELGSTLKSEGEQLLTADKKLDAKKALPGIRVGIGASSQYIRQESTSAVYRPNQVWSSQDISVIAQKDISLTGQEVQGKNIQLQAGGRIDIHAGKNERESVLDTKQKGWGIGATFRLDSPHPTWDAFATAGTSNDQERSVSYTPSTVIGSEQVTLTSPENTSIIGSQVRGQSLTVDTKNLTVASLQETKEYQSKQSQAGASAWNKKGMGSQWHANIGTGKTKQQYASVKEQAGLWAGDQGLTITANDSIVLTGAVLDSQGASEKNKIQTGIFVMEDIQNKETYTSTGMTHAVGKSNVSRWNPIGYSWQVPMGIQGDGQSITRSAVADTIPVRTREELVNIQHTNVQAGLQRLVSTFDPKKIAERKAYLGLLAKTGNKMIGDYALRRQVSMMQEAEREFSAGNEERAIEILQAAKRWGDGGVYKVGLHAVLDGVLLQSSGQNFAKGALEGGATENVQSHLEFSADKENRKIISSLLGKILTTSDTGASLAASNVTYNYLTHSDQQNFLNSYLDFKHGRISQETFVRKLAYYNQLMWYESNFPEVYGTTNATSANVITSMQGHGEHLTSGRDTAFTDLMDSLIQRYVLETGMQDTFEYYQEEASRSFFAKSKVYKDSAMSNAIKGADKILREKGMNPEGMTLQDKINQGYIGYGFWQTKEYALKKTPNGFFANDYYVNESLIPKKPKDLASGVELYDGSLQVSVLDNDLVVTGDGVWYPVKINDAQGLYIHQKSPYLKAATSVKNLPDNTALSVGGGLDASYGSAGYTKTIVRDENKDIYRIETYTGGVGPSTPTIAPVYLEAKRTDNYVVPKEKIGKVDLAAYGKAYVGPIEYASTYSDYADVGVNGSPSRQTSAVFGTNILSSGVEVGIQGQTVEKIDKQLDKQAYKHFSDKKDLSEADSFDVGVMAAKAKGVEGESYIHKNTGREVILVYENGLIPHYRFYDPDTGEWIILSKSTVESTYRKKEQEK